MLNLKELLKHDETALWMRLKSRGCNVKHRQMWESAKRFFQYRKTLWQFFELNQIQIKKIAKLPQFEPKTANLRFKALYFRQINQILNQICKLLQTTIDHNLQQLPNVPHSSVPVGDVTQNQVVSEYLDYPAQRFITLKQRSFISHDKLLREYGGLETEKTVIMSQPRFITYCRWSAQLLRALQNFLLDYHAKNAYQEMVTPYLINQQALFNTGQFPKSQADCYQVAKTDLFLLPTAEVTLVNLLHKKLFTISELPYKLTAYSPCFRQEAGAAGKENRGIVRLHQFHKVELVQICQPTESYVALDTMCQEIGQILKMLKIPFRIVNLATEDLAFQATKTYDVEIWWPSQQKFLEISSISNTESFQANALQIKYWKTTQTKELVHTLNGSGLALDRLLAIIIEYAYQPTQRKFVWPKVLRPYLTQPFFQEN